MIKIQSICTLSGGYTSVTCVADDTKMEIKLSESDGLRILALVAELTEAKLGGIRAKMTGVERPQLLSHIPEAELADEIPF